MIARRGLLAAGLGLPFVARAAASARIVVVGASFGGAAVARALHAADASLAITLVEREPSISTGPGTNSAIAGLRLIDNIRFPWQGIPGITTRLGEAVAVDPVARKLTLRDGAVLEYDRLVLAPGVDIAWNALPGYTEAAAERMPHAWKGEAQTVLLREQLLAMDDGGTVIVAVSDNPIRCPIAPYERASLIAHYLKTYKPKSKLLILDAKEHFSNQANFQAAWVRLYPGLLEWIGLPDGGRVTQVDVTAMKVATEFDDHICTVGNIIPPQRAAAIAHAAGVADRTGWCPVNPATFESTLVPGIHVIGDAIIGGAMPKAAYAAAEQARACAAAIVAALSGKPFAPRPLTNICYAIAAPAYGFSTHGAYLPKDGLLTEIEGTGQSSPPDAAPRVRSKEAADGDTWFNNITDASFA